MGTTRLAIFISLNLFTLKWVDTNRPFQFQKRSQLFVGAHNETLSVVAWRCISLSGFTPVISSALS